MNHLVNLYLSKSMGDKMLGCLIGEIVRTSNVDKYNQRVMEGIEFNKSISAFVRQHPSYLKSKGRLNTRYWKHSDRILDIFYDHLLAANWASYSDDSLEDFAKSCYSIISRNFNTFPYKLKKQISTMIHENWLVSYSSFQGIHSYMRMLTRRDTFQSSLEASIEDLMDHYNDFKNDFNEVFPDLIHHLQETNSEELVLQTVYNNR